jgi:methyl-accepting chemotaxis protein
MSFSNLKIGTRLGIGFAAILTLLALVVGIGMVRMSGLNDNVVQLAERRLPIIQMSSDWIIAMLQTSRHTRNMLILDDPEKIKAEVNGVMKLKQQRKAYMEALQKSITGAEGQALLQKVIDSRAVYTPHEDAYLALVAKGDFAEAKKVLLEKARPTQLVYIDALYKLIEFQMGQAKQASAEAQADYLAGRDLMVCLLAGALLIGIGYAYHVTRSITRPIGTAVAVAQTVAAGDLTGRIEVSSQDETGLLLQALKHMNDNLVNIVGQVHQGTSTIASASSQIASGNQDLSSRTEQQAGSLEETASSMEELTATVKQNADNARQANHLAASASDVARKGGDVVAQVVDTMGSINASANKIADIIGVIDGIAFQTNILALNAAVEAARAGEQGRGFAVVAAEVRNLAQRSAAAAKEIKALIGDSVEKVAAGSKLVDQAGATMGEIVASIERVTDIMAEITAASLEQSAGIEQVNQAISEMDQVTQQNSSLVEEAAAAANSLQEQAGNLMQVVGAFKLAGNAMPLQRPAPAAAAVRAAAPPAKKLAQPVATGDEFEVF